MKRALTITALAALTLVVSGCDNSPPTHKDPRQGRVTITYSDCVWGSCIYDWKVCVGRDLEMHIDGERHIIRYSSECKP